MAKAFQGLGEAEEDKRDVEDVMKKNLKLRKGIR
jgi:hypothetical protein